MDWEGVLLCLNKHKHLFRAAERETLVNKYVPIALNSIFRMLNSGDTEENRGKLLEQKYLNKVNLIQEEVNESDFESDSESEKEEELEEEPDKDEGEQEVEQNESKDEMEEEHAHPDENEVQEVDADEEVIDTSKKDKDDDSFVVISKQDMEENFEHLSNFDPEDEFLSNNKSFSLIGSVISNDQKSMADYSEYSIVSGSRISSIVNANTIQTNRDIYIEDVAMQKIIYYISLFSEETKGYLQKLRSKNQLNTVGDKELSADAFELELDNIDEELVKTLLDVLENFDMFRLCMIVCNRYNVENRLARYLTSVCYKYSNLKLLPTKTILQMNSDKFREKQQQVSVLANEAVHNMFSLVSPEMVKQEKTENLTENQQQNITDCWRFLFYLGFWKKLVYVVDSMTSLKLCYTIGDLKNFKLVYMINYREDIPDQEIKDLAEDTTGKWVDSNLDKYSPLGTLCYKVVLEDLVMSRNTECEDSDFECNILLNKWMSTKEDKQLLQSITLATTRLNSLMGKKNSINSLKLFDLCVYFGRIFNSTQVLHTVSTNVTKGNVDLDKVELFLACKTIMGLALDPLMFSSVLKPEDILIMNQGFMLSYNIRIPEQCSLFLHMLPVALMSRHSSLFHKLENYIKTYTADRFNQELIVAYNKEKDYNISHGLMYHSICKHMNSFEKHNAGRAYNFIS